MVSLDGAGVRQAVAWAETEGWEPGLTDAGPFYAADPRGFFGLRKGNRTIATISVVRGADKIAFVGFYIVDPDFRNQGFGRTLWNEVLNCFNSFTLGLDAVPAQVETYTSAGFVPAHVNARFSGQGLPAADPSVRMIAADAVPFDELVAFDAAHAFGPRPGFLAAWIKGAGRDALVVERDGEIIGFAASRSSSAGHRIGPVFADDTETARALILNLAARAGGRVTVDAPEPNLEGMNMLKELGLQRSSETARMYRGTVPELPLDGIFGITSLELG